jgi:ABC-type glycerol-3-phosphate transport system substrate-binding protein
MRKRPVDRMPGAMHGLSRRRFLLGSAGIGAGALMLGACGGGEETAGKVGGEITVWTWPDNDKTFEKTIPLFEKKNPGTKVKVQAFASDQYDSKLLATLVSGAGPDVAMVEITNVAKYKGKPGFVNLAEDPYNATKTSGDYADFSWNYVFDKDEDRAFVLPKNTGPGGLFYRRDVLENAGLPTEPDDVNDAFKTWDDYLAEGRKLAVKDERWLIDTPMSIVGAIRAQAGVSMFDESGASQLTSDVMVAAVDYAKQAYDAGLVAPFEQWSQEWGAAIKNGTVATFLIGNWFGGLVKSVYAPESKGQWGVTLAPEYDGNAAFNSGGDFIGILETSENKATAWEFVKFVTQDPDSLRTMYRENDLYPAWTPALEEDWMNEPDDFYAGQNVNEVFEQVSESMKTPVTNPNDQAAQDALTDAVTDVMKGKAESGAALSAAQARVEKRSG